MKVQRLSVVALALIATPVDAAQKAGLPEGPALVRKLLPSDGVPDDEFGISADLWGDTAVVGAWQLPRTGEAYVYERDLGGQDAWGEVKILRAQNAQIYEWFGRAVAIQHDRIVVGAPERNVTGTAIVFERDVGGPDNWGEVAELVPAGSADRFGTAVALDDDRIVVGAFSSRTVHIFERDMNSGEWLETAVLNTPAPPGISLFGVGVALQGDRIAVGDVELAPTHPGSAYVYERSTIEPNFWPLVKTLKPPPGALFYGQDVALVGDLLVVGGQWGRVEVFDRNQGGIGAWGKIRSISRPGPSFGIDVDLEGDRLAVGGSFQHRFPLPELFSVFVFERHLGGENAFGELARFTEPLPDAGNYFGYAAAFSGRHVLAGAFLDDELGMDVGAAYVYSFAARPRPAPFVKQVR